MRLALVLLLWAGPIGAQGTGLLEEITGILATNGIAMDAPAVQQDAAAGLLRAVDGRIRILSAAEAAELRSAWAGEDLTNSVAAITGSVTGTEAGVSCRIGVRATEFWPHRIAYLKVDRLYPGAGAILTNRLQMLATGDVAGVILDLRGVSGVDLDSVADVASLFAGTNGVLFTLQDLKGNAITTFPLRPAIPFVRPLMVVIDETTLDAGEVLADCLREVPRVVLVGTPTRGDHAVRTLIPLADGRSLLLANRKVIPSRLAARELSGVVPDVVISPWMAGRDVIPGVMDTGGKPLSELAVQDKVLLERIGGDSALRRAADLLLGLKALGMDGDTRTNRAAR